MELQRDQNSWPLMFKNNWPVQNKACFKTGPLETGFLWIRRRFCSSCGDLLGGLPESGCMWRRSCHCMLVTASVTVSVQLCSATQQVNAVGLINNTCQKPKHQKKQREFVKWVCNAADGSRGKEESLKYHGIKTHGKRKRSKRLPVSSRLLTGLKCDRWLCSRLCLNKQNIC